MKRSIPRTLENAHALEAHYTIKIRQDSMPRSPSSLLEASRSGFAAAPWWVLADCLDGILGGR